MRQLVDQSGALTLARDYQPYGETLSSSGGGTSVYGFTGEAADPSGLVYLRARYYSPYLNQFIQPDLIVPNPYQPWEWNRYVYSRNNPINFVDPTGLLSSEPIHAMIQAHFIGTFGAGHAVVPEYFVAGGSKQGLELGTNVEGNPILIGVPTGEKGFIDIADLTTDQAYEIKHERDLLPGIAEINWYISVYNNHPQVGGPVQLIPGTNYRWAWDGWEVIGTNPYYSGQVILAQMKAAGVITYKGQNKDNIPVPLPRFVWEWNHENRTVEKRDRTKIPNWLPNPSPAHLTAVEVCKIVIVVGGTVIVLLDPLPDDPLLPLFWGAIP